MGSKLVSDLPPLTGDRSDNGSAPSSLTEQFYNHLPFYLSIGMSFDQYWNNDCTLVRYYRKAHLIKKQRRNYELWAQGAYFYEALLDTVPVLHAFAKNGTKAIPYLSEPFPISDQEIKDRREREEKLRYDQKKAKFTEWTAKTNIQIAKREMNRIE